MVRDAKNVGRDGACNQKDMKKSLKPPDALLALFLPHDLKDSIVGDLEEEMRATSNRSALRGRLWFLGQAIVISTRFFLGRFRERREVEQVTLQDEFDQQRKRSMSSLWQDLRFGLRLLWKAPAFTAVAVASLALGIGANTTIFQLINAVRLKSLPVANPQEIVEVKIANSDNRSGNFNGSHPEMTNPQWEWLRDRAQSFSGLFAWSEREMNLAESGQYQPARGLLVSGEFFNVLGVRPLIGRVFRAADDKRGCGAAGVVLSHAFWTRRYGGAANVIGNKISLEGHPFEVIGVTEPSFTGLEVGNSYDFAAPLCSEAVIRGEYTQLDIRHAWWLAVMGRLKPGVSVEQATTELAALSPALYQDTVPSVYSPQGRKSFLEFKLGAFAAGGGLSELRERYQESLWILLGLAGLVLLIACANLANLLLARASVREREFAVKLALGASRARLIRQLLAESLMLALIGAALGAMLAQGLSRLLISLISTEGSALFLDLSLDWRLLGFTAGLAVLTSVLFGLTPAFRATNTTPGAVLKAGGRGMTAGRERFGLRRLLVISQVALSLVLLFGALLFARSLQKVMTVDPGFNQDGVLIARVDLSKLKLPKERRQEYKREMLEQLRTIPGVESAADASIIPMSNSGWNDAVELLGANPPKKGVPMFNRVSPGYFKTLHTNLMAGRDFDQRETLTSPKVAIVNESFAKKLLDGASPLGKRIQVETPPGEPLLIYEIVGLVNDTKYRTLREDFMPTVFVAAAQDADPDEGVQLMIRSGLAVPALTSAVKQRLLEISPKFSFDFRVFKTQIREGLMRERLMATLSGFFGFLAVLLASVGLYGVLSFMVTQRRNEIGIRMALGADRARIMKLILRDAALLLVIGLAIGGVLGVFAARLAGSMLYGLKPGDPLTVALAILLLGVVALFASYLPARRAARQDPMIALREE